MTTVKILEKARQLISKKEHWCKSANAKTKSGEKVKPNDPSAYAFCMIGAVEKIVEDDNYDVYNADSYNYLVAALISGGHKSPFISHFNDSRRTKHEDVLKIYDAAIKLAKEKEKTCDK